LKFHTFNFIDLFAAPGGLSLGFQLAGFRSLCGLDYDKQGIETYSTHFQDSISLNTDIRNLSPKEFLEFTGIDTNSIDLVIGSPPCQGFSRVGRVKIASLSREGKWDLNNHDSQFIDDPRNMLYLIYLNYVKEIEPKYFVMENVLGIRSYQKGVFLPKIKDDFKSIGYENVEYDILNSADFGVPQNRKRVIFIGNRLDIPVSFPEPIEKYVNNPINVLEAIGDLPEPSTDKSKEFTNYSKDTFHEYQDTMRNGATVIRNHIARNHKERDFRTFASMRPGDKWKDLSQELKDLYGYRDDIFHDKFRRLYEDKPSWTITAHLYKDGYAFIHPTQNRSITVREAARLQSFPDTFVFSGSMTAQFKQVGNAVPPLLAKHIATEIKDNLMN